MHVKMDELIRAMNGAHNALLDLEELDDNDLDKARDRYRRLAEKARLDIGKGGRDIGCDDDVEDDEAAGSP
jgi:low affinity Fe/Cu permease